jgi:hypothetical protein
MKSFCRGVQGGRFLQKESPLAAGGRRQHEKQKSPAVIFFAHYNDCIGLGLIYWLQ